MRLLSKAAALSIVALCSPFAQAQNYPAKSIRLIIPFPPGGATDLLGRLVAQKLGERVGHTVVAENRTGGGGNIGADYTVKAPADGYTIMIAGIPHSINMSLYKRVTYNLATDLTGISNLATFPSMIATHPSLPVKNMKELIALARSSPGSLNYGASAGSPNHLVMELIGVLAKVKFVHIGYKGAGPAIIDLIGGHLHVSSIGFPGAMPHVKTGRLRPIAVTSAKRSSLLPDLPTIAESALPGFNVTSWYGVFGPAKLPDDVVTRLNTEIRALMDADDVKSRLSAVGAEVETTSPQEYAKHIRSEIERWAKVVKASGATVN
ncbi:MAG: tripartite tricarboxylate transporter substrate binding protein [Betaproteobacteria bacterium]|nr:MAG: tripartite tricarboxylate transporter substrate binding protein [Betaproteobacteria bacterium]